MSRKLQNYLRTYRKRAGLSQDEVAFLLGHQSGAVISRYEHFIRQPEIQTVFAYELVFGVPARDLFVGVFQEVEKTTIKQAQLLIQGFEQEKPTILTTRKISVLEAFLSSSAIEPDNNL